MFNENFTCNLCLQNTSFQKYAFNDEHSLNTNAKFKTWIYLKTCKLSNFRKSEYRKVKKMSM